MAKKETESLADTLSALRKKGARVGSMADFPEMEAVGMTTGNLTIDSITGINGIPRGRITELFGPPSSGKTTTAIQTMAALQAQGETCMFLDFERTLDPDYCKALGLNIYDTDTFIYMWPEHFEEGVNTFREIMPKHHISLLVVDSVARMVTETELNSPTGKATMADRARMMGQFLRQITGQLIKHDTAIIFLNHEQDVVDLSPMGQQMKARGINRKTTPGGVALKYYASLRMGYKQTGNKPGTIFDPITNEEKIVPMQTMTKVTAVKNKVGDPFRTAEVRVRFGKGFSNVYSAFDVLVNNKIIRKDSGGIFVFMDDTMGKVVDMYGLAFNEKAGHFTMRGEENVLTAIENNPELRGLCIQRARDIISTGKGVVAKASEEELAEIDTEDDD